MATLAETFCGIDLGGTTIKLAISDARGQVIAERSIATGADEGPNRVLCRIGDQLDALLRDHDARPVAIGMGVPGLVDVGRGITKFLPNLAGQWIDVPVAEQLTRRFGCPVRLLNDARTATLGERRFGRGRDQADVTMIFLSVGTGIGGGIVIDGKIRLGPLGAAGELGHQTVVPDGPRCGCGNRGCLETVASGTAIAAEGIRLMRMGLAPTLQRSVRTVDEVTVQAMSAVADRDPAIAEVIATAGRHLGLAIANLVSALHPDLVVVAGGVSRCGESLLIPIRDTIHARVRMFPIDRLEVQLSELSDRAGVLGAIALATDPDFQTPACPTN